MISRIPLHRYGTVSDISSLAAFLASSEASYITGQVIYVDGGITVIESTGSGAMAEFFPRGRFPL